MLGRTDYTKEELDHAKTAVGQQLAAYKKLVKAIDSAPSDSKVTSALEAFEPLFFNNMTMVLDRHFVHRVRMVTGKDGNPLNEVERLTFEVVSTPRLIQFAERLFIRDRQQQLEAGIAHTLAAIKSAAETREP